MSAARKRRSGTRRDPAAPRSAPRALAVAADHRWWRPLAVLVLAGLIVFGLSLRNSFVLDDESQILGNGAIRSLSNLGSFFAGSSMDTGGAGLGGIYYKPLMTLAYAVLWAMFGPSGAAFHGFQLALHLLAAWLTYRLFLQFFSARLALALALVFLVHPINAECVVYAADLQDTLYLTLGLGALAACARPDPFRGRDAVVAGALLLMSLLSKETGVLFVAICLLHAFLFARARLSRVAAGAIAALLVYALLRFGVAHLTAVKAALSQTARATLGTRLLSVPLVLWHYVATFVLPIHLTVTQDWVIQRVDAATFWLPLLADVALTVAAIWYGRRRGGKPYAFFALWAAAGFALHAQVVPLDGTVADRWFYFTGIGVLGMLGTIVAPWLKAREEATAPAPQLRLAGAALLVLVVALGGRSLWRTLDWRDGSTLYAHDLTLLPDSFVLLNDYGVELARANRDPESEVYFRRSTDVAPYWNINWSNLGATQQILGRVSEAEASLKRSIANGPYALAYENYARLLATTGRLDEARRFLNEEALPQFPASETLAAIDGYVKQHGR
jgi:hypothetical protein